MLLERWWEGFAFQIVSPESALYRIPPDSGKRICTEFHQRDRHTQITTILHFITPLTFEENYIIWISRIQHSKFIYENKNGIKNHESIKKNKKCRHLWQ